MPLKWNEVSEKPEFQSLTPDEKEAARLQYFDEVIKPQAQEADLEEIKSQFDADTRIEGYTPKPSEDQVKYFEDNKATNDKLAALVYTPEEIERIKNSGKIGFVEAFNYTKWEDAVPFVGMAKKGYDLIKLNNIAQKPQDQITEEERGEMVQYLRDQLETDLRGVEVGGNIAFGVWQAPAFMVEFAATMGAGKAVVGAGKAALGYTAKKAVEKSILQMGKRELLKKGAEATGHALLATALNVPRITASYNEKMLNERTSVTDKGQAIFKEAETSPFTALAKTYGELAVENVSEVTGPAFGLLAKPFAPIVSKLAPYADNIPTYALSKLSPSARDALVKAYRKTTGNTAVSKMFSKAGWNGMLNELGEERVGDVMRFALDLDKEEGYSLDQLYDVAIPDKEQLLVEAGVIGILGTGRKVGNYLVNTLQEKSGMTKTDAEEVVRGMTATEQDSLWETMSKEDRRASLNNVEERAFKQFTESGIEEAEAKAQAKNYRAMAKWGAERAGVSPEAFYENLKLTVKKEQVADNPTPENAKAYTKEVLAKLKRDKAESAARKAERPVFDGDEIVLDPILPEVSEAIGDLPKIDMSQVRVGKEDTAITPTGKEIGVQFAVVESDSLIASQLSDMRNNPKYPKAMQPRDRSRLASQQQISQIAASLNPRMVMDNPLSSEGAPVIGNDYVVESGNGRVLAITRAYEQHPEKAQEYVNALKASGYDVEGMKRPVLVRIRKGELSDAERVALAQESNQRTTAAMSSTEQAMTDASRIPETILGLYQGGGIALAANRPFVRAVVQSIVPQNEQGAVFTKDGELSQEAERRIGAAMLAKAYGNESILRLLTESTDNELTTLGRVLVEVSPAWAQMREAAKAGTISPAVDITGTVIDTARLILRSRREGKPLSDFFNMDDMLGDNIPTLTRELTKNLFSNDKMTRFRSFPKLSEMFRFYVEEAQKTTAGENLFGEAPVSPSEIIAQAYRKVFEDGTGDLFQSGKRGVGEDVSTDGGKRERDTEGQTVSVGGDAVVRAEDTRYQLDYGTLWGRIVNLEGWLARRNDFTQGQVLSMERELRKAKKELKRMERDGEALLQSAYHGSPYRFERFDLSKIGTGEGAQAYGWGQYFAESLDVAKSYSPRDAALEDSLQKLYEKAEAREDYVKMEVIEEAMLNKTPQEIIDRFNDEDFSKEHRKAAKEVAAYVKKNSKGSQAYKVEIPDADIERMLDWDNRLDRQSPDIRKKLKDILSLVYESYETLEGETVFLDFGPESDISGARVYEAMKSFYKGAKNASEALAKEGIVGIKYLDQQSRGAGEGTRNFVVFDQALLDKISDSIETLYQSAPTFYSALQRGVEGLKQDKADAKQWTGMIRNMQGVKAEEIEWSGVQEWLAEQNGSVSRQAILDYLKANELQVQEVVKGNVKIPEWKKNGAFYSNGQSRIEQLPNGKYRLTLAGGMSELFTDLGMAQAEGNRMAQLSVEQDTKFSKWQLEGEKTGYRELLLTLPQQIDKESSDRVAAFAKEMREKYGERWSRLMDIVETKKYDDLIDAQKDKEVFKSSHFEEPNIVAHIRFNERTDADGKRVLFIEEIQSDWHQAGRKKGYKSGAKPLTDQEEAERKSLDEKLYTSEERPALTTEEEQRLTELTNRRNEAVGTSNNVPDAPFKTTWPELAFKRVLRYAAENGFERVAWTTGEQQAERYDLSNHLSELYYWENDEGEIGLSAYDLNDRAVLDQKYVKKEELEGVVGKEIADRIFNGDGTLDSKQPDNVKVLRGDGLKIGGEGMKGFYDDILPKAVNKLVKKWGGRVGKTTLSTHPRKIEDQEVLDLARELGSEGDMTKDISNRVHSIDITAPMKDAVMKGLPLFQDGVKGSVTFKANGEKIVNLFEKADKSTFLHETGHIYLREMRRIAGMSKKAKEEFEIIKKHLGSTDGEFTVAQEEQFARNFEQYFMEGYSPNKEMRGVFDSFKKWLFEIYKSVRSLNGTLNNEVRDVFDQMLGGKDLDIYSMDIPLDNTETMFENFYRNMINDLQPLENLVKKFEKLKGKLRDGMNPVMLARLGMRVKGQIIHNITKETYYLDANGNYVSTGEGLKPILDDFDFEMARVEPYHNARYADLEEYLVAQRYTKDLMAREGVKITPRQAEESITTLARLTKKYGDEMIRFDDYAQRIYDFQARILQNLVRSGIKTQEWYDGIIKANPHYIPFQRVFDEGEIEEGFFIGGKTKYGASGEVIKELKGSEREVKDVFNSILKNTGRIIDAANRNVVALEVAAMGRVLPDYVQETEESGPRTIRYYENGEIKKINVTEGLWLAMSNVHPAQHSVFTRLFAPIQFSATLLRVGATAMPDFWIRNFMRDQAVSRIQATAKMGQLDVVQGLMSSLRKDASYERWKAVGGGFDSYMDLSDKNIEEAYREIMDPKGKLARYLKTGGLAALQDASMIIEEGPRLAVFKAAKKAKMSDMASALDSNDATVDFRRAGTIGRVLNRYIPFLNAGIQGVDKMIRAFQKNPALMSYRAFTTITVSQIIMTGYYLYAAPDDEREEYLEIPQWRKDIAFPIKIGDSWWYMPKPFALGYVFGSLPERFMIWSYKDGDPAGEDLWKEVMMGIGQSISPIQDIGAIMTPAGRIAVESITNYNFFTGRSIYPEWLDKLPPEEQSNKYTSETAKLLGQSFGISPALIDNAIRGQLGGASAYGVPVTDSIIKTVKEWNGEEFPEKPTTNADLMFLRGFSIRRPSGYNAISTQTFMKKYSEFEQYRAAYDARKDEDKAEYYEKHEDKIIAAQTLKPIREQIQSIGKSIDRIYDDKDMSAEDKVYAISELEDQMLEIAKDGNETILELVNSR